MKIGIVHPTWLGIAEHAGFMMSRCEVGQVQGIMFAEGIFWTRGGAWGPLEKIPLGGRCVLGHLCDHQRVHCGDKRSKWLTRTVRRELENDRTETT